MNKIEGKTKTIFLLFALISIACTEIKEGGAIVKPSVIENKEYTFESTPIWADEFNSSTGLDATKWVYDLGAGGWGNDEKQFYTEAKNLNIANGILTIQAKKEILGGAAYTSTRITTKGKGDWLYGRFEIKAKVPTGKGTWPAFWMLPTDNDYGIWPNSGEIDIMEHVGYDPNQIHSTVHTLDFNHMKGTQVGNQISVPTATSEFHVYRVDWTPAYVRGFVDNTQYFEFKNSGKGFTSWPFDKRFHLLLNLAIGGGWGGKEGIDPNAFPADYSIDYVRVYKLIQ
jgi:beta-glucanase (GH16 family)